MTIYGTNDCTLTNVLEFDLPVLHSTIAIVNEVLMKGLEQLWNDWMCMATQFDSPVLYSTIAIVNEVLMKGLK